MSSDEPLDEGPEPEVEGGTGDLPPLGGDMAGVEEGPEPQPEGDMWWGLRNSEPPNALQQARGEADLEAEWTDHFMAGVIKQTGSGGLEAWMHYVMAVMLLVQAMNEADGDSGGAGRGADHDEYHHADAGEPDESLGGGDGMAVDDFL